MRSLKRTTTTVIAALAVVALMAGCSSDSSTPEEETPSEPVSGGVLVYDHDVEPFSFDPQANADMSNQIVAVNIFDTLLQHGNDGKFYPQLAETWEVSDDGLTYDFTLREDVTFHDGTPVDAAAIKANWDRGSTGSTSGTVFGNIAQRGGTFTVTGPLSFQIKLTAPYATTLDDLSFPGSAIIAPAALTPAGLTALASGTGLIGSGPFKVVSYTKGSELVLERNAEYNWGPGSGDHQGPAYLDGIEIRFVPEAGNRVGALTSGQADAIIQVPTSSIASVKSDPDLQLQVNDASGMPYVLELNQLAGKPFSDPDVREAFRTGIDIDGLLEAVYSGTAKRAWSIVTEPSAPIGSSAQEDLTGAFEYDQKAANKLLDKAGYTTKDSEGYRTKDGQRLSVTWLVRAPNIRDQRDVLAQGIQAEAKELGIEVVINPVDNATYFATLKANDYDLSDTSLTRADAYIVYAALSSKFVAANGGYNWSNTVDPEIDALLATQFTALDDQTRIDAFQEVQQIVNEQAALIPINVLQYRIGSASYVHGIGFQLGGFPLFYDSWIDGKE
ncbi:ABC transporter substrate-binding protein [Agromyces sp. MMS24-JH15]|uniref:ABC transporter substrate-binding protein n=1 Tax=Agromyces sp. MMS24-JH15 TaxID=3243765 RepID=UPI0037484C25